MHREGRKSLLRSDQLVDLLTKHAEFQCHEIRDRVVALLSLAKERVRFAHANDGTEDDFVLGCCIAYNGNLECMARLAKTLNVAPDQLVQGALAWQQLLNKSSQKNGSFKLHMVVAEVGCNVITSPRHPLEYRCAGCKSSITRVPASILTRIIVR